MRRARVAPTKAATSHAIPACSKCLTSAHMQRNDQGQWFCVACADDWLREFVEAKTRHKSIGGVALPVGVQDVRRATPSFRDLMPNRAARRRIKRGR